MKMTIDTLIEELKEIALQQAWDDDEDFMADDYAGGNIDDAFYGGHRSGRIDMAREVLINLGIEWDEDDQG